MSFFIKNKRGGGALKRKFNNGRKNDSINEGASRMRKKSKAAEDAEISSDSDEDPTGDHERAAESSEDEFASETAKEKHLRLAEKILEKVREEEKDREEFNQGAVAQRLRDDYLEQKGRLRKTIASNYSGHGDLIELRCKNHSASITCLCLTNDGKFLYSGSKDGSVVKWSVVEKTKINIMSGKRKSKEGIKSVLCIAVSTDGKFLAIGDAGCKDIKVFSGEDLKPIKNLQGHRGVVTGLAFRRDTHTLYSASDDRSVKVWNLDAMAYVESLFGHQTPITSIDALTRERAITSGGFDKSVRIWKIAEESQLIFNGHGNSVDSVKLINEDNFISCGDDGQLCLWNSQKKKPLCSVTYAHGVQKENGLAMWISSIATLVNTDLVASGSSDGAVRLWKCGEAFKSLELLFEVKIIGFINSLVFTPNGENLIVGVGQEHKSGRWWRISEAKNKIVIVPLKLKSKE